MPSSILMNVNPIGSGGNGATPLPMIVLVVAVGIGYVLGASTIGKRTWNTLLVLEEWIRDVVVPCYTLSALLYLLIQNFEESISSVLSRLQTSEKESGATTESAEEEEEDEGEKPIDMNGTYKVVENDNFAEFLKAQGVPGFLCNAASKARPTHEFTHKSIKKLTIRIRGIIESETSYEINGPYTETTIRGRLFQDSLSYLYDDSSEKVCCGVQTRKVAMGQGYVVLVQRRVIRAGSVWNPTPEENPDGHNIYDLDTACEFDRLIMTNKVVYDNGDEPVIASQLFHRTD